jgi:hypothetical protein
MTSNIVLRILGGMRPQKYMIRRKWEDGEISSKKSRDIFYNPLIKTIDY